MIGHMHIYISLNQLQFCKWITFINNTNMWPHSVSFHKTNWNFTNNLFLLTVPMCDLILYTYANQHLCLNHKLAHLNLDLF